LSAECEYCHREINITLQAPAPVKPQKHILDEARRLALIEHLRTEHTSQNLLEELTWAEATQEIA
jgi:hypothetical protein